MVGSYKRMAVVVHTCNPSTPKAGAGGSQAQGQPGLLETLSHRDSMLHRS